jgi:hypothetical protein
MSWKNTIKMSMLFMGMLFCGAVIFQQNATDLFS